MRASRSLAAQANSFPRHPPREATLRSAAQRTVARVQAERRGSAACALLSRKTWRRLVGASGVLVSCGSCDADAAENVAAGRTDRPSGCFEWLVRATSALSVDAAGWGVQGVGQQSAEAVAPARPCKGCCAAGSDPAWPGSSDARDGLAERAGDKALRPLQALDGVLGNTSSRPDPPFQSDGYRASASVGGERRSQRANACAAGVDYGDRKRGTSPGAGRAKGTLPRGEGRSVMGRVSGLGRGGR